MKIVVYFVGVMTFSKKKNFLKTPLLQQRYLPNTTSSKKNQLAIHQNMHVFSINVRLKFAQQFSWYKKIDYHYQSFEKILTFKIFWWYSPWHILNADHPLVNLNFPIKKTWVHIWILFELVFIVKSTIILILLFSR